MIDIEGADKKVKQMDGLLSSIERLLKKHWLILLVVLLGFCGYWVWTTPDVPMTDQTTSNSDSTSQQ